MKEDTERERNSVAANANSTRNLALNKIREATNLQNEGASLPRSLQDLLAEAQRRWPDVYGTDSTLADLVAVAEGRVSIPDLMNRAKSKLGSGSEVSLGLGVPESVAGEGAVNAGLLTEGESLYLLDILNGLTDGVQEMGLNLKESPKEGREFMAQQLRSKELGPLTDEDINRLRGKVDGILREPQVAFLDHAGNLVGQHIIGILGSGATEQQRHLILDLLKRQ